MDIELDDFYTSCMNCENCKCNDIWNDKKEGIPPRGFYYLKREIQVLVVAKNPGHPFPDEYEKYKNLTGKALFDAYRKRQNCFYNNLENEKDRSSIFHKNMYRYLSVFLNVENKPNVIYQKAAHTNLVKCSTRDEQAKLSKNTLNQCYEKHFHTEIELFRPKVILALGKEVENYLLKKDDLHIPVVGIKHPSYFYKKELEGKILEEKRMLIQKYISECN